MLLYFTFLELLLGTELNVDTQNEINLMILTNKPSLML